MDLAATVPVHGSDTASRVIGGEATLVLPKENTVHILNPVGTRIWELADGQRSLADIVETLCDEFRVAQEQAEQDARSFVEELVAKGMMELESAPSDHARAAAEGQDH